MVTDGIVQLSLVLLELGLQLVDRFSLGVSGLLLVVGELSQLVDASLVPPDRLLCVGVTPLLRLQLALQLAHLHAPANNVKLRPRTELN